MDAPNHKNFIIMTSCLIMSGIGHLVHNMFEAAHYITGDHITMVLTWMSYITASGAAYRVWKERGMRISRMKKDKPEGYL